VNSCVGILVLIGISVGIGVYVFCIFRTDFFVKYFGSIWHPNRKMVNIATDNTKKQRGRRIKKMSCKTHTDILIIIHPKLYVQSTAFEL